MQTSQGAVSRYSSIILCCLAVWFSQSQLLAYNIGDRVQVINGPIYVRYSAGGTWTGYTQPTGSQGTVLNGPTYSQIGGTGTYYYWYNVNFDSGTDGWVADVGLTSAALPNLTPYLTPGWTDKIIVSRTTGTTTDSTSLTTADTLYVDWSVINNGSVAAGAFYVYVYVDGTYKGYGSIASLSANTYATWNDLSIGTLSAGTHTIQITADATGAITESNEGDNSYSRTITVSSPSQPNLTPYKPTYWSDKIVVSKTVGNYIDSTGLTTADTIYLNWAAMNTGTAAAGGFYIYVYVDGSYRGNSYTASLSAGGYTYANDFSIGTLSAGSHTIQITADATGAVSESNESDNSYTKTISVIAPSLPNLTPYTPSGWSDKIVVSRAAGNNIDSTSLTTADTLYIDWAVINNGNASVSSIFYTELYVDGVLKFTWNTIPPLGTQIFTPVTDYSIGSLVAGTHTIRIKTDSTGVISESNEGDNEYTKTISVAGVSQPNLTPFQPSGWSDQIVVSRAAGNNTDSTSLTTADSLFVDWAVINSGSAAVNSIFYTYLYVDGTYKTSWYTPTPLNANYYTTVFDYNIGPLSAGTHTISITTDATGVIGESSEADNTYTKTINVTGTSLPEFVVTSISLSPSAPAPGQAFTAYVTVKNQGAAAGNGGWLDVWANQPSSQSCGADGNTWTSVGVLTANQSKTFTFSLTAGSAGSQTFRAFVDSACQTTESNEGNNQSTLAYNAVQPSQLPDFLVTSISLSPASPQAGQTFTASVTVKNQGAGAGAGGWLDVWANQASAPSCGTDGNTWASVGALSAGQSKTFTLTLTAAATGGGYTFRAFVDSYCQTTESNDGNNQTTLGYTVGAASALPDFLVTSISFNPAQPIGGQPFTAYVTVKNQGAGSADGKYLDVWVNQPSVQSCGANGDQYQSVGTLTAGQSKIMTFNLTALAGGAPWTFRSFVDSGCQTTESNDGNNQTTASYGANPVAQPDFLITSISTSPSSPKPGDAFTAYVTVKNQGAGSGDGGWLDVWANKATTASCGDSGDTWQQVGVLAAGVSKTITLSLTAGPAGANTLRAFVDSSCQTTESNEGNNQNTFSYNTSQRVLLLLHGMNADPTTWEDYIDGYFYGSAPIIKKGIPVTTDSPTPDSHGVVCYRIAFGSADFTSGRTGAEGTSASDDTHNDYYGKSGDYSSFDDLGVEVAEAVNYILSVYGNSAQITLVGHSRGGLAARAFLQTVASSPEKSSVVALLTTGTPHKGSRLGRIYGYLVDPAHPRTTDSSKYWKADWDVVDFLRGQLLCTYPLGFGTYQKYNIDVTRPTIEDLADDSTAIYGLNNTIQNLPTGIKYGAITYTGADLGLLQRDTIDYHVFYRLTADVCYQLSHGTGQAEDTLLDAGKNGDDYPGDGIVPLTSQGFDDIPNFPAGNNYSSFPHTGGILHIYEPKTDQTAHINDALNTLFNW